MKTAQPSTRKVRGAHFTPPALAEFLASRLINHARDADPRPLRVLDPACGDGELLAAFRRAAEHSRIESSVLVGVESDSATFQAANERLIGAGSADVQLHHGDFLGWWAVQRQSPSFWTQAEIPTALTEPFDVVIANPPYVRTQVMGARTAQKLAAAFGLSGRVDLYHPFLIAATEALRPGGLLGVITSNRFLFTQAGAAVRAFLSRSFEVLEIIDLGDTKLFEAAVLPAIFIGRRVPATGTRSKLRSARFIRIYSHTNGDEQDGAQWRRAASVYALLNAPASGTYRVPEGIFDVTFGQCGLPSNGQSPWAMLADEESAWLESIRRNAVGLLKDFAQVRVGIKTTADRFFIRSDWETLPAESRPEPAVLHPLLTHEHARRWKAGPDRPIRAKILYTHEVVNGRRQTIDFRQFPKALRYLNSHREELESRKYVIEAGRKWYEIWVPQDPEAWALTKVVCPDISPEPRFYLDRSGMLVDGDSYWTTLLPGQPEDLLYLILAVANSRLMATYHDLAFNNRLYAGRRRYLTQHVSGYPLPDPNKSESRELIALVRGYLAQADLSQNGTRRFEGAVNELVAAAFSTIVNPRKGERQ